MTFTVTYDRNGATGGTPPVDAGQYLAGDQVTVLANTDLVKLGAGPLEQVEHFANWNTKADGSGTGYGGAGPKTYTMGTDDVTFYAQWFTTAGLTNQGTTAHYQFWYDSALQRTPANPAGIEPERTNAVIADCEDDFAIMQAWFSGVSLSPKVTIPIPMQVANLPGGGAQGIIYWPNVTFTLSPGSYTLGPVPDAVGFLRFLIVAEITEMFMYAQGKGWFSPDGSGGNEQNSGEGLSNFLARQFLAVRGLGQLSPGFQFASYWLDSVLTPVVNGTYYGPRSDYVNQTLIKDIGRDPATGCAILFIYYLFTQLGFSIPSIVGAAAPTLAGVYHNLTGDATDPFPNFKQLLDTAFPPTAPAMIPGPNPDNPWPLRSRGFHPVVIAKTGQDGLTGIGRGVSVNDSGAVAFVGSTQQGQGIFVAAGAYSAAGRGALRNINPGFSSDPARMFSDRLQINNAGKVAARDQADAQDANVPLRMFVRVWDSQITDSYDLIAAGGGAGDRNFSDVLSYASINSAAAGYQAAFCALPAPGFPVKPVPAMVLVTPGTGFTWVALAGDLRPRISDVGSTVVRAGDLANSPLWVYPFNQDGSPMDVAAMGSASPCFSAVGRSPGISADGRIVGFYGDLTQAGADQWGLTPGPGIFASIQVGSQWTIHRVAGIGGDNPAGFVADAPVGVNSVRMFTYLGTDAAGNKGLYLTRLSFFSVNPPKPFFRPVAAPTLLAAQGSMLDLADGTSLGVVQDIDSYDSLNNHGDVAFWVQTIDKIQAVVLMPRGSGSDYLDPVHAAYINSYDAGYASDRFPAGLPRAYSDNQRGGDACGAAALIMLLNATQYAAGGSIRQNLLGVYQATADQPIADPAPGGNNFNWIKGRDFVRWLGFPFYPNAKYFNGGKAAIDAQLANNVAVVASTRFGLGASWSKGHCVLLLSHTPADPATSSEGFYVVDDPAGYVVQTPAGGYGHYGRGQCGEHVIYPESLVAQALTYPDGSPRYALVLNPVPGTDPDVLLVIGRFGGTGPRPFQLWLQDPSGRQSGWLPGGQQIADIPDSEVALSPIVGSDPSAVPDAPPDGGSWPYAVSVASPPDGLRVFVSGNVQAGFSLEALRYTASGVIRSVTSGTVTPGETQEVTLAAPVLYDLTLSADPGGSLTAAPAPGPYPDGTQVAVTATHDLDHIFAGWTVDGTPGYLAQPLTLVMDANRTVTANFTAATLRAITLSPASPVVTVGAARQFHATGTYSDGTTADLTASAAWSASDTNVATISPAGLAAALRDGTVTITAALAGLAGTATLTVAQPPVLLAITVSPVNPSIAVGAGLQVTATGTLSDGTVQDLTATVSWSITPAIAAIGATGIISDARPGSAAITATVAAISGSTGLTVVAPPVLTAIAVVPVAAGVQRFRAMGTYSDGSSDDVTSIAAWSTSDTTVATMSPAGVATEVKVGSVTIGAAAAGISGSASLAVTPPVLQAIVVSPVNPGITAGTAVQFTATGIRSDGTTQDLTATASWSSTDTTAATVGATGIATGYQPGATTITAAAAGVTGSAGLAVSAAPALQAIAVTPARPGIAAGGTVQFTAIGVFADGSTRDLTSAAGWFSGTTAVATINATGGATGAGGGITMITATAGGFSGSASLTVTAVPVLRSIAVTPADPSVAIGATAQFTAAGTYTDGSTADVTSTVSWSSTDLTIATVTAGGLATAVASGTVSITAAAGTIRGSAGLTVTPPLTTVTWVGTVSGSWHDAPNWSTGQVPGPFNDVVINAAAGIVVTYSQGTSSVHSLTSHNDLTLSGGVLALGAPSAIGGTFTLSGGAELDVSADVLVAGPFTWTGGTLGGTLGGPGKVTAAGGLAISGNVQFLITGCTLENTGHATWTSGNITLGPGGAIVNSPAAEFDVQFGGFIMNAAGVSSPPVSNAGVFRVSAGTGTVSLQSVTLHNTGTIDLLSGTLNLEPRPGSPGIWTGSFTGAAGTTLVFAGPHDLRAGSSLAGPAVVFDNAGGPVNVGGSYDITGSSTTTLASPAVNFTPVPGSPGLGAVTIASGVINFSTGQPVTLPSLAMSGGGALGGSDDVLVAGPFSCAGGELTGPGKVTAAGGLAISGNEQLLITGCTMENTGTATWTSGNITLGTGGAIVNAPGALLDIQFDAFLLSQAGTSSPPVSNAGTLRKSAGTGTAYLASVTLYNTGTIDLRSGTLNLEPRPISPGIWTGTFTGAPDTALIFTGPHDLRAGSSLTGPAVSFTGAGGPVTIGGAYDITGSTSVSLADAVVFTATAQVSSLGALTVSSGAINFSTGEPVTLPGLALSGAGALGGTDDVLVAGPFTAAGGTLTGPGKVTAAGGLAISGNTQFLITGRTLENTGHATWTSGTINLDNGAVFRNTAAGTFDVACDGPLWWCGQGPSLCQPTGLRPVFDNAGKFTKSAGAGITSFVGDPDLGGRDVAFTNAGAVEVASGRIAFGGIYTQTAGSLLLTGGNVSALGLLDIQGGALSGTGTVTANVQNAGLLDMGASTGVLTITGSYAQLPAGQLTARLGGLSAGTQYDQLTVEGAASLDGKLALVLVGGFTPATGDTFNVLTYTSKTGSFTIDGAGHTYTASYESAGLAIIAS